MSERTQLEDSINGCLALEQGLKDAIDLIELGESEGEEEIVTEAEASLTDLLKKAKQHELEALLSGEADSNDTFLEVHAGAGGTEAQDWAEMLLRMYMRWAEKHPLKRFSLFPRICRIRTVRNAPGKRTKRRRGGLKRRNTAR